MNIKYILTLFAATAAVALTSCSDFLEPKSNSEFVPKDAEALNQVLLGEAYPRTTGSYWLEGFVHLFDDDVAMAPYQTPLPSFDANQYRIPFTWQPDVWNELDQIVQVRNYNIYYSYYEFILGCNAILDYIDQAQGDLQDDINNVLAQAYTLRAFYYLNLVNIFGVPYNSNPDGPGVPLKLSSSIEDKPLSRSSVREVYESVVNDLRMAISLYETLPVARQWKTDCRTSLPMAQLLLSRAYLYMENWQEAAKYSKMVMDNPNFTLMNLNNMDLGTEEEPKYPNINGYDLSTECIWPYGRVEDFTLWMTEKKSELDETSHSYFVASPELLNSYEDTDLRKKSYIIPGTFTDNEGNLMQQAVGKVTVTSEDHLAASGLTYWGRSIRLSEAYLNYAEAMVESGLPGDAINTLNELRKCRFSPENYVALQDMDVAATRQFVRDERRRELCYEGHRWFDLRRWGMPSIKHVWYTSPDAADEYVLEAGDPQYVLPFPNSSLEANPQLSQNVLGPIPRQGNSLSF